MAATTCDHVGCTTPTAHAHGITPDNCDHCAEGTHGQPVPLAVWACGCGYTEQSTDGPQYRGRQCPNAYGSHPVHRSSSAGRLHFAGWAT